MIYPKLKTIPKHYFKPSDRPGTLEILNYPTFESFSYTTNAPIPIEKEAVIYLPYGYSDQKKYPVVYLSNGGWSSERTTMGSPHYPNSFKHIMDHAIANGEIAIDGQISEDDKESWLSVEEFKNRHKDIISMSYEEANELSLEEIPFMDDVRDPVWAEDDLRNEEYIRIHGEVELDDEEE